MKRLFLVIVLIFLTEPSYSVTYNSDPKIFVTELVDDALKILSDKTTSSDEKANKIEEIALGNVDIKALGMYTLGDLRKSLDTSKLNQYNIAFERYFLKSLTSRLSDYSSNKFEVLEAEIKNSNYTIVKSKIVENSDQPEIKIDWRIYTKDKLRPLIRDLIVEGLSLARTQKEEFASILNSNNNDIKILTDKLDEFVNK